MSISARLAATVLAFAVIGLGLAAPAKAACCQPQPTVPTCTLTFKTLKAVNLWDDGDSDFIAFQINDSNFPGGGRSVEFFLGTVHTAAAFNYPVGTANIIVRGFGLNVLVDEPWPLANVDVPEQQAPLCGITQPGLGKSLRFSNGDAVYDLTYDLVGPN